MSAVVPQLDLGPLADLGAVEHTGECHQHPLRILSQEGGIDAGGGGARGTANARSDTFSVNSERFDVESLPCTDQLNDDEELLNEDELEQAMAASMGSVRSHDVLQQLRDDTVEAERRRVLRDSWFDCNGNNGAVRRQEPVMARLAFPEGSESLDSSAPDDAVIKRAHQLVAYIDTKSSNKGNTAAKAEKKPSAKSKTGLVCCASMISSESSGQSYKQNPHLLTPLESSAGSSQPSSRPLKESMVSEKLHRPTVPELPLTVSRQITATLTKSGLPVRVAQRRGSANGAAKTSTATVVTGSLPRPEVLTESATLPRRGWRTTTATGANDKSNSKKKQQPAPKKSSATSPTHSGGGAGLSGLLSFIRSPTHSAKNAPTSPGDTDTAGVKKRASSGYESADATTAPPTDSVSTSLKTTRTPSLPLAATGANSSSNKTTTTTSRIASPYSKVTNPRPSQHKAGGGTSSGNASDSSGGGVKQPSKLALLFTGRNKPRQRESLSASSGYESGGVKEPPTPSAKTAREKHLNVISGTGGSSSAPQTPIRNTFEAIDKQANDNLEVLAIKDRQEGLKLDLQNAKHLLGIPKNKWDYGLHAMECMRLTDAGLLEALRQETKILEKRVVACRNHAMLVTAFL